MTPFIGQIQLFGFNFAPQGWAHCDGQLLPILQNQALFSLLGTQYGGDGEFTFALPDLRGRVPIHFGQGPGLSDYNIGSGGGNESTTLTTANLPPHNHTLHARAEAATVQGAANALLAETAEDTYATGNPTSTMGNGAIGLTGSNLPFDNRQPYRVMNYCIALVGIFPSPS